MLHAEGRRDEGGIRVGDMRDGSRIELSLPANRDMMLIARLATAGVVARAGLPLDALDDVKMAVEEACLFLMDRAAAPEDLRLTFDLRTGAIAVRIDGTGAPAAEAPEEELEVVRCILESLVRAVDIRLREDGTASVLLKA